MMHKSKEGVDYGIKAIRTDSTPMHERVSKGGPLVGDKA